MCGLCMATAAPGTTYSAGGNVPTVAGMTAPGVAHFHHVRQDGTGWPAVTKEDIERVLREAGLSDEPHKYDSSIHSWRCEHPDRYGEDYCTCLQELVEELFSLLSSRHPSEGGVGT